MVSSPPSPPNGATTNLPPEVLRAMMQQAAQSTAFQAPRGIKGLGSPALKPPGGAPPVEEDAAAQANAAPDAAALQAVTTTDDVEGGPNQDADDDRDLDDLGYGERPLQGPRGHSNPSFQHPLDRAADTIRSELQETSKRMAGALFPQGPAGSAKLSRKAMLDYVGRHWEEPDFRTTLLDRVAPKGPDGTRLASGVRTYLSLYRDAVVNTGKAKVAEPPPPAPPPMPPPPGPAPVAQPATGPPMGGPPGTGAPMPGGPPSMPPPMAPEMAAPMPMPPPMPPPGPPPGPNQLPPTPPPM
jgi:hypothetical protein